MVLIHGRLVLTREDDMNLGSECYFLLQCLALRVFNFIVGLNLIPIMFMIRQLRMDLNSVASCNLSLEIHAIFLIPGLMH